MADPTPFEQYLLELINRARLDPGAEVARYGTTLNAGLGSGTLDATSKQPLAMNLAILDAARAHSQWMVDTDVFSHTGAGGSNAGTRMAAVGYTGSWGENIVWQSYLGSGPTQGTIDSEEGTMIRSAAHRANMLNDSWNIAGIGSVSGAFMGYSANVSTEDFGRTSGVYLTGVVYADRDGDGFYDIGEGLGALSVAIRAANGTINTIASLSAGGYQQRLAAGTYTVTFGGSHSATVTLGSENDKVDFVNGDRILSSASTVLGSGILHGTLLGLDAIDLAGNASANRLIGNGGANVLTGCAGNDTIDGGGGSDTAAFSGTYAQYTISRSGGTLVVSGSDGIDTLTNVEKLSFSDRIVDAATLTTISTTTVTTISAAPSVGATTGDDTLAGTGGADRLEGLAGDDTYIVDNSGDVIVEAAGAGTDTVRTAVAHTLEANVEDMVLTGMGNITVAGNALGNRIDGNTVRNQIFGGAGNDTLWGGGGADTLAGGDGADVFVFRNMTERVVVSDFADGTDRIDLSMLVAGVGYTGSDPLGAGIVKLAAGSGGSTIAIDADGAGSGTAVIVATLASVGLSQLDASDFRF